MIQDALRQPPVNQAELLAETSAAPRADLPTRDMVGELQEVNLSDPAREPIMDIEATAAEYGVEGSVIAELVLPYKLSWIATQDVISEEHNRHALADELSQLQDQRTLLVISRDGLPPLVGSKSAFGRLAATPEEKRYQMLEVEPDIKTVDKGGALSIGRDGWLPEDVRRSDLESGRRDISRRQAVVYNDDNGVILVRSESTKNPTSLVANSTPQELEERSRSARAKAEYEQALASMLSKAIEPSHKT